MSTKTYESGAWIFHTAAKWYRSMPLSTERRRCERAPAREKLLRHSVASLALAYVVAMSSLGCHGYGDDSSVSQSSADSAAGTFAEPLAEDRETSRRITDMFGRRVTVPTVIDRVLTTGPIEMELVYLIAPNKLVGLSFPFNGQPPLVPEKLNRLPVTGGWFGTQIGNYETFIAAGPDIILESTKATIKERQEKLGGIPVIGIHGGDEGTSFPSSDLTEYESEIRFLGELLGVEAKAERLAAYYLEAMRYVKGIVSTISKEERISVYYAEGKEGLGTDPAGSMHTRLLEFCGGRNVAEVSLVPGYGMAETSLEQIIMWDPDVIIIGRGGQPNLFRTVMTDATWSRLRAVKSGRVFLRPDNPCSWFDGPPGPCEIVGMYWMVSKLYPDKTTGLDLKTRVKRFYTEFLHYDLTDEEYAGLMSNPKLKR